MILKIKRRIRNCLVRLDVKTEKWVLPERFWNALDEEKFDECETFIEQAYRNYPDDPHVVYAQSLLTRLSS